MVNIKVDYNGASRVARIEKPLDCDGWGTLVNMVQWTMGYAYLGSGRRWDPGSSTTYNFSKSGDDGVWQVVVTPPSSSPLNITLTDLSFKPTEPAQSEIEF